MAKSSWIDLLQAAQLDEDPVAIEAAARITTPRGVAGLSGVLSTDGTLPTTTGATSQPTSTSTSLALTTTTELMANVIEAITERTIVASTTIVDLTTEEAPTVPIITSLLPSENSTQNPVEVEFGRIHATEWDAVDLLMLCVAPFVGAIITGIIMFFLEFMAEWLDSRGFGKHITSGNHDSVTISTCLNYQFTPPPCSALG